MTFLVRMREAVSRAELAQRLGKVSKLQGLAIEAEGPRSHVGELCAIVPPGESTSQQWEMLLGANRHSAQPQENAHSFPPILAEVVGIQSGRVTLMPYGSVHGLKIGSTVVALGSRSEIGVGNELRGRVIDGFGRPLDGRLAPVLPRTRALKGTPLNPMERPRIGQCMETGVRIIDALLTLGRGQRMGIFAGSGVGKSTLLGMIARHVKADVNVIALIGERGREVREFIDKQLGPEGLARSVVIVATADQPALARIRATQAALAIAEYFRDNGQHVLFTMDSVTRFAMARREVGLSAGEPPTARGYTPSVFAELPELCERCGTSPSGGSITALLTVLVEGDDFNEPVSDALRAILDGHIVLSRHLAHQGQYPAIDVLKSASRLLPDLTTANERENVRQTIRMMALLDRNRQMVELGAYEKGSNPELDKAILCEPQLQLWLRQMDGGVQRAEALRQLRKVLEGLDESQSELRVEDGKRPTPGAAVAKAALAPISAAAKPNFPSSSPSTPAVRQFSTTAPTRKAGI